jgi:2-phosphosulfolactate phosphatase
MAGRTVLVVDVLRASTTMIVALAHGAEAIVPVVDADEARQRARALGAGRALLAGERRGEMIDGFDAGNSPAAFTTATIRGRTIVFTTSNGTRALLAARRAAAVGVAALVNLSAAAAWARSDGRDVTVICAGERGRASLEDTVCAGLLVERIGGAPGPTAAAATGTARRYAAALDRLAADAPWARHLAAAGHGPDVAMSLVADTTTAVPVYLPHVDKVVLRPR